MMFMVPAGESVHTHTKVWGLVIRSGFHRNLGTTRLCLDLFFCLGQPQAGNSSILVPPGRPGTSLITPCVSIIARMIYRRLLVTEPYKYIYILLYIIGGWDRDVYRNRIGRS